MMPGRVMTWSPLPILPNHLCASALSKTSDWRIRIFTMRRRVSGIPTGPKAESRPRGASPTGLKAESRAAGGRLSWAASPSGTRATRQTVNMRNDRACSGNCDAES